MRKPDIIDERFDDPIDGPTEDRIEPESPSLESTLFVALGILSTLAVVVHLIGLFG